MVVAVNLRTRHGSLDIGYRMLEVGSGHILHPASHMLFGSRFRSRTHERLHIVHRRGAFVALHCARRLAALGTSRGALAPERASPDPLLLRHPPPSLGRPFA